jgi:hypothetical protein
MSHTRGIRIDKLKNGNYRLILFGHFSQGTQSQELNDVALVDLEEIQHKIDIEIIRASLKS